MQLAKPALVTSWICQIVAAAILGQTLYFKFTGAPESVYIFSALNAEPWGRIGSGVLEAIAVVLLLYPKTPAVGAVLALGLMAGAIGAHLTKLGIDVQGDGGTLFGLALTVAVAAAIVALLRRREFPIVGARF
ncbi:MAG: DoxX family protein [Gemmatimonadales bacterium]